MKLNVRLLRKIQRHITAEPRRLHMEDWGGTPEDCMRFRVGDEPPCGTVACIGGWAHFLTDPSAHTARQMPDAMKGAEAIGVEWGDDLGDEIGDGSADRLFYLDAWPAKFRRLYGRAKSPRQRAKVTCARIDHFIQTKGAE